jgi:hypothetical protein
LPLSAGNNAYAVGNAKTQSGLLPNDYILNGCTSESRDHSDESVVDVDDCAAVSDRDCDFGSLQSVEPTLGYVDSFCVEILTSQ